MCARDGDLLRGTADEVDAAEALLHRPDEPSGTRARRSLLWLLLLMVAIFARLRLQLRTLSGSNRASRSN